ncbi:MAG: glycosyltransferase family 2 protein [Hyphomonadaceae bacterium]|nr:glycosyltransferase family 2 protein [Hyphomonadaceae bacterium]MBY0565129.1 glycosyltransferase family 2 protein [Hyphomonadaceae bacterium]
MSTLVSILIPCFNAAPWVRAAVESALNQTYENLEVVVVDDGSTDDSAAVLASIRDRRLKIIRQSNRGQCAAANRAYAESIGELIKFFDADDLLSPDHIERQINCLGERRDAVALAEWARFYGDDPTTAEFAPSGMYRDALPADWLATEWMNARPMMQSALWLIPRPILERSGLWDERLSLINDFEFFARVLLYASQILYCPGARLYYRSGLSSSLSGRKTRKAAESALLSLMLGTQHLLDADASPRAKRACANVLQDFVYSFYPEHGDLRAKAITRVKELGGADLQPDGPPGFHRLRNVLGWKVARRAQRAAERLGVNAASLRARLRA